MKMSEIVPAIITRKQEELDSMLQIVKDHVSRVQLDFMDGKFVPNNSLDFDFKLNQDLFYEAHLMIEDPLTWIKDHANKVDLIIPHFEAVDNLGIVIDDIKNLGKKTAVAINPGTAVDKILDVVDKLDLVLVMTVEPGFYGSKFLPDMLDKVKELKKFDIQVEVDGGIAPGHAKLAKGAGADIFVSGSFIFKNKDPVGAIKELKEDVK